MFFEHSVMGKLFSCLGARDMASISCVCRTLYHVSPQADFAEILCAQSTAAAASATLSSPTTLISSPAPPLAMADADIVTLCGVVKTRQKRGKHLTFLHLQPTHGVHVQVVLVRDRYLGPPHALAMHANLCVPGSFVWCRGAVDSRRLLQQPTACFSVFAHDLRLIRAHHEPANIVRVLEYTQSKEVSRERE
jgi:hypothetical protein